MGLTEMPFHCLLKNVSLDLTMGVQNNSSKYCWIGRVFDLIYYSPFKKVYPIHATPTLLDIVSDDVDFYAHCVTKFGIKMNLWEKVGNISDVGGTSTILFRDTDDYGVMVGEEPIKISHNWFVWHINDDKFTYVGNLEGENRKAEIGVVMPPLAIVERIKTGKYSFVYPEFE